MKKLKKKKKTENGIKIVMPSFEDKLHISVDYFILSVTKCYTSTFDANYVTSEANIQSHHSLIQF